MPLKTKQVGEHLVSEMGTLQVCNFRVNQRNIAKEIEQNRENEGLAEWLNEWAFLAAVTTPFISREKYAEMDIHASRELLQAAEELNAGLSEVQASEPQSKKKHASKTPKSTPELEI